MTDQVTLTGQRQSSHGNFRDNARVSQHLKKVFRAENLHRKARGQQELTDTQMDALDMIAAKIGRIFAGDAGFHDHWDDIAGYAHIANKEAGSQEVRHAAANSEANRGQTGERNPTSGSVSA